MQNKPTSNWKTQSYMTGIFGGLVFGALAAYLFTRAAEDEVIAHGQPQRIQTGQLIGIALACITLVRQITELGKPAKK